MSMVTVRNDHLRGSYGIYGNVIGVIWRDDGRGDDIGRDGRTSYMSKQKLQNHTRRGGLDVITDMGRSTEVDQVSRLTQCGWIMN